MSRSRAAVRTFSVTMAASGSAVLVGLITTPLLLRWLGDERVGAYRVAVEWVGYLALLDFGLSGALQVALAKSIGRGDREATTATVRAGMRAGARLAVLTSVCVIGLAAAAPHLIRGLSSEVTDELQLGLLVSLVGGLWAPLVAFRPLVEASQRGYVVQAVLIVQQWVTCGLLLGLAAAGAGLPGMFLATTVGVGIGALLLARDGIRRYPEVFVRPAVGVVLPTVFSGAMFVFNLCSRLSMMSDAIVIGLMIGPAAVVVFTVTQRLLLVVDAQVLSLGTAVWSALAELYHRGEVDRFNARLTQLTRWTGVLSCGLLVPVAAATPAFVALWVGEARYGGDLLTLATVTYVWLHGLIGLWGWPLVTLGRVRQLVPVMLLGTVVNVAISVSGTLAYGVAGPALGSAGGYALVNGWWIVVLLRHEFGTPIGPLLHAVLWPVVIAAPLGVTCFLLAGAFPVDQLAIPVWGQWVALAGAMAAAAVAYFVLAWFLVLPRADREELRARVLGR